MNQFATQADMMSDKTAYYKTEKAINEYRKSVPLFENLWIKDNPKCWKIIQLSADKV